MNGRRQIYRTNLQSRWVQKGIKIDRFRVNFSPRRRQVGKNLTRFSIAFLRYRAIFGPHFGHFWRKSAFRCVRIRLYLSPYCASERFLTNMNVGLVYFYSNMTTLCMNISSIILESFGKIVRAVFEKSRKPPKNARFRTLWINQNFFREIRLHHFSYFIDI